MKVFICWSGELSRGVAGILRAKLPCIIQTLDVFMSDRDLESGGRWGADLAAQLDDSSFGIMCLTPDNLRTPWIMFEAGALTKHSDGLACGLLLGGLEPSDVTEPLTLFQHQRFTEDGVGRLLRDINKRLPTPIEDGPLADIFGKFWPEIEAGYQAELVDNAGSAARAPRRPEDMLEELVNRVRAIERSVDRDRRTLAPDISHLRLWEAGTILRGLTPRAFAALREIGEARAFCRPCSPELCPDDLLRNLEDMGLVALGDSGPRIANDALAVLLTPEAA